MPQPLTIQTAVKNLINSPYVREGKQELLKTFESYDYGHHGWVRYLTYDVAHRIINGVLSLFGMSQWQYTANSRALFQCLSSVAPDNMKLLFNFYVCDKASANHLTLSNAEFSNDVLQSYDWIHHTNALSEITDAIKKLNDIDLESREHHNTILSCIPEMLHPKALEVTMRIAQCEKNFRAKKSQVRSAIETYIRAEDFTSYFQKRVSGKEAQDALLHVVSESVRDATREHMPTAPEEIKTLEGEYAIYQNAQAYKGIENPSQDFFLGTLPTVEEIAQALDKKNANHALVKARATEILEGYATKRDEYVGNLAANLQIDQFACNTNPLGAEIPSTEEIATKLSEKYKENTHILKAAEIIRNTLEGRRNEAIQVRFDAYIKEANETDLLKINVESLKTKFLGEFSAQLKPRLAEFEKAVQAIRMEKANAIYKRAVNDRIKRIEQGPRHSPGPDLLSWYTVQERVGSLKYKLPSDLHATFIPKLESVATHQAEREKKKDEIAKMISDLISKDPTDFNLRVKNYGSITKAMTLFLEEKGITVPEGFTMIPTRYDIKNLTEESDLESILCLVDQEGYGKKTDYYGYPRSTESIGFDKRSAIRTWLRGEGLGWWNKNTKGVITDALAEANMPALIE